MHKWKSAIHSALLITMPSSLLYPQEHVLDEQTILQDQEKFDVSNLSYDAIKSIVLGEEFGFSMREIAELKQVGTLESVITNTLEETLSIPAKRASFELIKKAELFLEPYNKIFMPEVEIRELIHATGMRTFPRPIGIPENFRIRVSDRGCGMVYVHPEHNHTSIRIMPGKPHSPFPHQQKPYVIQMKDGKVLDKFGNAVTAQAPEAHIPFEDFFYKE